MSSTLAEILIERSQPHLLQSIVARAATLLKVESAELLIYDAGHEELTLAAHYPLFTLGQALLLQSQRDRQPLAVALLDVDYFKRVNDTYGHAIGDQVLTWIAAQCREHLPAEALLGRIGGEEFAVLLPGNTSALAWVQLEGLRHRIATTGVPTSLHHIHVTISAGVTECLLDLPQTLDHLLEHADRMLYQAKHEGRNRVCADSLTPTTVVPTQAAVGPSCTHLRRPARSNRKLRRLFRPTPHVR